APVSASTTVFFPEKGVSVKKAWFRIRTSTDASQADTITATTTVGSNAESAAKVYAFNSGGTVANPTFQFYHVIPSSDYAALEAATATSGVKVTLTTRETTGGPEGLSAELLVTYTYTSDLDGYMVTNSFFAG